MDSLVPYHGQVLEHATQNVSSPALGKQVLSNQKQWDRLGWPMDRKSFSDRLNELREVRNELMHFNDKDKVGDAAIPMLRNMIELLREYGG